MAARAPVAQAQEMVPDEIGELVKKLFLNFLNE
jgi:hypothetical protein